MEEALLQLLAADVAISALVADRIRWGGKAQGEQMPCIVLYLVSELPDYVMSGPTGLAEARVQVDCWGDTAEAAVALHRAVRARLSGYRGFIAGVRFGGAFQAGRRDTFEESDARTWNRVSVDYTVWAAASA